MYQSTCYVERAADTFGDDLLAYGVAPLLAQILRDNVGKRAVAVRDAGSVYAIGLDASIRCPHTRGGEPKWAHLRCALTRCPHTCGREPV